MLHRFSVSLTGLLFVSTAWASPTTLYDGSTAPDLQGWQKFNQQTPYAVSAGTGSDSGTTRFTTTTQNGARTSGANLYKYSVGTTNFIASIRLKAVSVSQHNQLDAGLMFSVTDTFAGPAGNSVNRSSMLYLDATAIGWGDDTGSAAFSTLGAFHEYAVRYHNGQLSVYIDTDYAAIASGTATPVLSRTLSTSNTTSAEIVFGDQSNDPNVDSDFFVDYVQFQSLDLPGMPSNIIATGGDSAVRVSFMPPASNGSSAITQYNVTAIAPDDTPVGHCTPALPASGQAASCVITGLTNGTTYTISSSAVNASGPGPAASTTAQPQSLAANIPVNLPGSSTANVNISGNPPGCVLSTPPTITSPNLSGAPDRATAPLDALRFTAANCSGATLTVRIDYPMSLSNLTPYKFGPASAGAASSWFPHGSISGNSVSYTVVDDGVGDSNTTTPGAIEDPFALLALPAVVPSAGSTTMAVPSVGPFGLAMLTGILAGTAAWRNRRRSRQHAGIAAPDRHD